MKDAYDFSSGVRGKYVAQFARSPNVVVLAPDVAAFFKTTKAVNDALRETMVQKLKPRRKPTKRPSRRGPARQT